jgi:uncharacterized protein
MAGALNRAAGDAIRTGQGSAAGRRRRARGIGAALVYLALLAPTGASAQPPLPELTQPVNDFANVVEPGPEAEMDGLIRALQRASGDVVVVATIPTYAPYADIQEYAVEMFENRGRGIGARGQDNGLLVLLSIEERRVWVEVGYGLEGIITDGFAGEVSRNDMVPGFRTGDYGAGLLAGVRRIIGRIAQAKSVTIEGAPPVDTPGSGPGGDIDYLLLIVIAFIVLSSIASAIRPRRRRGRHWGGSTWSGWNSGVGSFGGGGGGFGGGFGGFGGGRSGGGGGGAGW